MHILARNPARSAWRSGGLSLTKLKTNRPPLDKSRKSPSISLVLTYCPGKARPNAMRKNRTRALAFSTLSVINDISGDGGWPIFNSSRPLPIAPIGLIKSWHIRDPINALSSRLSCGKAIPPKVNPHGRSERLSGPRHARLASQLPRMGRWTGAIRHQRQNHREFSRIRKGCDQWVAYFAYSGL